MLHLDNKITGTKKCIGVDAEENWSWSLKEDASWIYGDDRSPNAIRPLMSIYGQTLESMIPTKYARMIEILGDTSGAKLMKMLGPTYTNRVQKDLMEASKWLASRKDDVYLDFYKDTNEFLWSLQPAEIDPMRYRAFLKQEIDLKADVYEDAGALWCKPPIYAREKSSTGRLSVVEGIRILTMRTEYRKLLKDAWQIDFQAMEPRFLLSLLGREVPGDFYDWVKEQCGFKVMDRDAVKLAVLSSMYGHKNQIQEVTDLLGLSLFEKELEKEVKRGWIKNWFGRPIHVKDARARHLVSLWLQSTATDAALLGFKKFCEDHTDVTPHWVIHDALFYSGDSQTISSVSQEGSIIIEWNGQEIAMPYKIGRV
jgi:hypothetical protein